MGVYDWYPANHTYDGMQLVSPHYLTMPDRMRVFDILVRTQGWPRWQKRLWRKARDLALARWGYPVEVVEKRAQVYPSEGITLGSFVANPYYGANSYGGFGLAPIDRPETSEYDEPTWDRGAGFALVHPKVISNAFTGRVTGLLAGTICHEVGHALGFGHGGTGIMESVLDAPYYPNEEELWALRQYWGRA